MGFLVTNRKSVLLNADETITQDDFLKEMEEINLEFDLFEGEVVSFQKGSDDI